MKVRKQFDLERMKFTQQSDEEQKLFSTQLIQMYNKQYSLVLAQTKNFFADCKDFITRFMTLNNMGIGFNLPFMLNAVLKIQAEAVSPIRKRTQSIGNWQTKNKKFQKDFAAIMDKMGQVVQELLNFQLNIKTAYLGEAFNSPSKNKTRINRVNNKAKNQSNSKYNFQLNNERHNSQEQQKMLRTVLQKNMTPQNQVKPVVCNLSVNPIQNIERLNNKIDKMKFKIKQSKVKEEKIWNIFNEKRPSRNMLVQQEATQQDFRDREYKKMNDMLSDMISQKNKNYSTSPFQTVDSSFNY